jgi:hypothetical protein
MMKMEGEREGKREKGTWHLHCAERAWAAFLQGVFLFVWSGRELDWVDITTRPGQIRPDGSRFAPPHLTWASLSLFFLLGGRGMGGGVVVFIGLGWVELEWNGGCGRFQYRIVFFLSFFFASSSSSALLSSFVPLQSFVRSSALLRCLWMGVRVVVEG